MTSLSEFIDFSAEDSDEFEIMPAGEYVAQITQTEIKPTQKGGLMWNVTWQIIEGDYANRLVWTGFNVKCDSAKAVEISGKVIRSIAQSIGLTLNQADNPAEYPFKPHIIVVGIEPGNNGYGPKNKVTKARPLTPAGNSFAGAMNAGATSAPPARPASPPPGAPKAASAAGTFSFRR
jgi:hypothetical protein